MSAGTIKEFVVSNGWVYHADCGCRNNFGIYINKLYPKIVIWVSKDKEIMQVRSAGHDSFIKTQAGIANYQTEYLKWVK